MVPSTLAAFHDSNYRATYYRQIASKESFNYLGDNFTILEAETLAIEMSSLCWMPSGMEGVMENAKDDGGDENFKVLDQWAANHWTRLVTAVVNMVSPELIPAENKPRAAFLGTVHSVSLWLWPKDFYVIMKVLFIDWPVC